MDKSIIIAEAIGKLHLETRADARYATNFVTDLVRKLEMADTKPVTADELRSVIENTSIAPTEADKGVMRAYKWVEARRDAYVEEHGSYDPETGATEFPGTGEEYVGELEEIIEGLRALVGA